MLKRIQEFVHAQAGPWRAQLECGHIVDVRPDAALPRFDWVQTEHGRKNLVGSLMECPKCQARSASSGVSAGLRFPAR